MMRKILFFPELTVLTFALLACMSPGAEAQSSRGTITGTITDSTHAAVPGASVKAVNQATSVVYSSTSNSDGNFDVPQLPEGRYKVTVEKAGFKASVTPDIELLLAQTLTLNISLEIGEVTQSVNVGTGVSNVETTTSELATNVGEKMVIDLPLAVASPSLKASVYGVPPPSDLSK